MDRPLGGCFTKPPGLAGANWPGSLRSADDWPTPGFRGLRSADFRARCGNLGAGVPWPSQAAAVVALNNYSFGEALRLEEVVTDAHQRPFTVHFLQAPQQEPP
jgi:hypothetical protein